MNRWRDPWPLPRKHAPGGRCSMDHDETVTWMTRRYAEINGEFAELRICLQHDGAAGDPAQVHPEYGRRRCANRQCSNRWQHDGDCP